LGARACGAHLGREPQQLVGGFAHGAHHHDHVVTGTASGDDTIRDPTELGHVGDGGASVLLDHDGQAADGVLGARVGLQHGSALAGLSQLSCRG